MGHFVILIQSGMLRTDCNIDHIGIFLVRSDADINSRDHSGKKPRQVAREGLTIEAQGKKKKKNKRRDLSLPWSMCIKKFTMQNGRFKFEFFFLAYMH